MWKTRLDLGLDSWSELLKKDFANESQRKEIARLRKELSEPLTLMIAGEFKAGKSTFINALLGEEILTSDVTPATAVVTMLTYGRERIVLGHFKNGTIQQFGEGELKELSAEVSGKGASIRRQLSHIELKLPLQLLKQLTIIDTPGLNSDYAHHTRATEQFLDRSDIAFWVFNYRTIGSASEVEMIRKIQQAGTQL